MLITILQNTQMKGTKPQKMIPWEKLIQVQNMHVFVHVAIKLIYLIRIVSHLSRKTMITQTHLFQKHWNIDIRECKNREFVCKVCHMNLKTGNVQLLDHSTHSRNHETEHNKKYQGEFTSNISQHDVNVKQITKR